MVMLYYYTKRSPGEEFTQIDRPQHHEGIWYHCADVTVDDIDQLLTVLPLDRNIVRDVLDEHELPRVEYDEKGTIYLFLRAAKLGKAHTVRTSPLLLIATQTSFVSLAATTSFDPQTVTSKPLRVRTSDSLTLLFLTVASTVSEYEELLGKTSTFITNIKGRLRSRMATNDDFLRFISIEDNLNMYEYNLEAIMEAITMLRGNDKLAMTDRDKEALDDIVLHIRQLLASITSKLRSVHSIQSVHATVSNNILNQRMKVLTVAALLITIPNAIYGMYGMNIALPFQEQPWAYAAVSVGTVVVLLLTLLLAKRYRLF